MDAMQQYLWNIGRGGYESPIDYYDPGQNSNFLSLANQGRALGLDGATMGAYLRAMDSLAMMESYGKEFGLEPGTAEAMFNTPGFWNDPNVIATANRLQAKGNEGGGLSPLMALMIATGGAFALNGGFGGMFGGSGVGGAESALGGLAESGGALPYFDAGAGAFIDPATGLMMDTTQALQAIGSSGAVGADSIASLTNYANTAGSAVGGGVGASGAGGNWLSNTFGNIPGGGGSGLGGALSGVGNTLGGLLDGNGSWLGAGLGALGSYLDAANQPDQITSTNEPWSAQQPYLLDMFQRAQEAMGQSSDPTNLQNMATSGAENLMQNPLFGMSQGTIGNLMGMDPSQMFGVGMGNAYMGMDNPYLQETIDNTANDVLRNMRSDFATAQRRSGSFGNSGLNEAFAREVPKAIGNIASQQRMGAYQQDAGLYENMLNRSTNQFNTAFNAQNNAAFNTPAWGGQLMNLAGQAYGMGQQQANQPFDSLNQYKNIIGGNYGQTNTQPNYTNPWSSALGGGMMGYQLGKLF